VGAEAGPLEHGSAQGSGIVEFEQPEEAAYAISHLHLTMVRAASCCRVHVIQHVRIRWWSHREGGLVHSEHGIALHLLSKPSRKMFR